MIKLLSKEEIIQNWTVLKRLLRYCREAGSNVSLRDSYYENKLKGLLNYLENGKTFFFVMEENKDIVGFLWACEIERDIENVYHILYFAVFEEYQGKGYGKLLIEAAQEQAREKRIRKIELNVNASNDRAINFYRRNLFYDDHITMVKELDF